MAPEPNAEGTGTSLECGDLSPLWSDLSVSGARCIWYYSFEVLNQLAAPSFKTRDQGGDKSPHSKVTLYTTGLGPTDVFEWRLL